MHNTHPSPEPAIEGSLFKYALAASFLFHVTVFIYLVISHPDIFKDPLHLVEINYLKMKVHVPPPREAVKDDSKTIEAVQKNARIAMPEKEAHLPVVKDISKLEEKMRPVDKEPARSQEPKIQYKVSIPVFKSEKINNPLYQTYYQTIRSIIRKRAEENYNENHTKSKNGEVYLTFVVLSNGTIKGIKLIPEKSSGNEYWQNIGLRSIQESDPFPPFPPNLNYPELSFNIVIRFEVEELWN